MYFPTQRGYAGFGDVAPADACACPAPAFPWWMIAVGAAVGIVAGYVTKDQMDKKKGPKPA